MNTQNDSKNELPAKSEQSILTIIQKEGYVNYEIEVKKLATDGSYIGELYQIDISGTTHDGSKQTNIFLKNKTDNEIKIYSIAECFVRECFAYKELSKVLIEIQNEAGILREDRFTLAKTYDESSTSSIILENLSKRGFKVYYRMDVVSLEYAELSVQQLAKFHALSFVIQVKMPEYFNSKIKTMHQLFTFGEDWNGFVQNMYNYSINCLDPDVKTRVEEKIYRKVADYPKYMNDTSGVRTMCHGDYKHNNIMAKEVNNTLTEVIPVDYQLLHYGSPILDLLYFIFNGTDQEFRRNHLTHLKDLYYVTMEKFLERFEIQITTVYSRTQFEKDFKDKLDFGVMIYVFYLPFLFASEDDVPDVTNQSLSLLSFNVDKRFTDRFRGVVDDFIQWGYL